MTTAFNWLPAGAFRVGQQKEPGRPPVSHEYDNPFLKVAKFARFMGLTSIPAATITKLKTDPYYRYCFYRLKEGSFFTEPYSAPARARLKEILLDPAAADDKDFFWGVRLYLNNFPGHLPGGAYRVQYGDLLDRFPSFRRFFSAVDGLIGEGGHRTALSLLAAANNEKGNETDFSRRAAYLRFCLRAFNELVARGFTPQELWA